MDDDLAELEDEAMPEEVRKYLAATFAGPEQVLRIKPTHNSGLRWRKREGNAQH